MTIHPDQLLAFGIPLAVCVAGLLLMAVIEARGVRERVRRLFKPGGNHVYVLEKGRAINRGRRSGDVHDLAA